ncbi:hypothetical protein [Terasakiella pusilla]|uniref:hypothetical protein n=1 Tax=Terasakiella pusilla TaxID=64973 RepID=UPI003AA8B175
MGIKVPTAPEAGVGQVKAIPLNTPVQRFQTDSGMFGGDKAQAMMEAGRDLGRTADLLHKRALDMKKEDQDAELEKAELLYSDEVRKLLQDPEKGYFTIKGKAAFDAHDTTVSNLKKAADQITAKWSEGMRQRFNEKVSARRNTALDQMARHAASERNQHFIDLRKAQVEKAGDDAVANWTDHKALDAAIDRGLEAVHELGRLQGWSKEVTDQAKFNIQSAMHSKVLDRMIVESPSMAKAYFSKNKEEIDPEQQAKYQDQINTQAILQQAQSISDNLGRMGLDYGQQLQEVQKLTDPELRKEVLKLVDANQKRIKAIRQDRHDRLSNEAWNIVEKELSTKNLSPEMRTVLDGDEIEKMDKYASDKLGGKPIQTNWETYYALSTMATDNKEAFAKLNLMTMRPELSDADFKQFVNLQQSAKTNDAEYTKVMTPNQMVNSVSIQMDLSKKKTAQLQQALQNEVYAFETATGKKATPKDVQDLLDNRLLTEVRVGGMLWDSEKHVFELEDGERNKVSIKLDQIGTGQRRRLHAVALAAGLSNEDVDNDLLEHLGGAFTLNDHEYAAQLLGLSDKAELLGAIEKADGLLDRQRQKEAIRNKNETGDLGIR